MQMTPRGTHKSQHSIYFIFKTLLLFSTFQQVKEPTTTFITRKTTESKILIKTNSILLKFFYSFLNCVLEFCMITLECGNSSTSKVNKDRVIYHQAAGTKKSCHRVIYPSNGALGKAWGFGWGSVSFLLNHMSSNPILCAFLKPKTNSKDN